LGLGVWAGANGGGGYGGGSGAPPTPRPPRGLRARLTDPEHATLRAARFSWTGRSDQRGNGRTGRGRDHAECRRALG
jgi:hypothetical protein